MKKKCNACGKNPVPHSLVKIESAISIFLGPMNNLVINGFLGVAARTVLDFSAPYFIYMLRKFGVVKMNNDLEKAVTERSREIWREAKKRNIKMEQVVVFGKPTEIYIAIINDKKIIFESIPNKTNKSGSDVWMDDKYLLKKNLQTNDVPTPKGKSVCTWWQAKKLFHNLSKPIIVKPRLGSRSRHTNTKIFTLPELKKAYQSAKVLCMFVMIEEELSGSVYRGTVVDGKLIGVLKGTQPTVIGDGKSTIESLIKEKNKTRKTRVKEIEISENLIDFLSRQNLDINTIPKDKQKVQLSEKVGIAYGGDTIELWPNVHPKLVSYIEKAGKQIGGSVIGFDFILTDPKADPDTQNFGIIECNSLPFIDLHYHPLEGPSIPVAEYVWDMWQK